MSRLLSAARKSTPRVNAYNTHYEFNKETMSMWFTPCGSVEGKETEKVVETCCDIHQDHLLHIRTVPLSHLSLSPNIPHIIIHTALEVYCDYCEVIADSDSLQMFNEAPL